MPDARKSPPVASEAWMLEQQMRAEAEAAGWRQLRLEGAKPSVPVRASAAAEAPAPALSPSGAGSAIVKGLVRFALAAGGSWLAFVAGLDSGLGEFEIWLATGAAFLVVLAFSAFGPLRSLVYFLAESMRWVVVTTLILGLMWVFAAALGSAPTLPAG